MSVESGHGHDYPDGAGDGEFTAARSKYHERLEVVARTQHLKSYSIHPHERWQLTWFLSGKIRLIHRGGCTVLQAGDAVLAAPFEPIGAQIYQGIPFGFATVQIPREILQEWPPDRVVVRSGFSTQCEKLLEQLIVARDGAEQTLALNVLVAQFLATNRGSRELAGPRKQSHPAIRTARELLDHSLSDRMSLIKLAHAIQMNHRYVISIFKNDIGISPHQYVIARRVEAARYMINQGVLLNAVATDAGFNDQSHLTRQFKRAFGITPGTYRARHCHMNLLTHFPATTR